MSTFVSPSSGIAPFGLPAACLPQPASGRRALILMLCCHITVRAVPRRPRPCAARAPPRVPAFRASSARATSLVGGSLHTEIPAPLWFGARAGGFPPPRRPIEGQLAPPWLVPLRRSCPLFPTAPRPPRHWSRQPRSFISPSPLSVWCRVLPHYGSISSEAPPGLKPCLRALVGWDRSPCALPARGFAGACSLAGSAACHGGRPEHALRAPPHATRLLATSCRRLRGVARANALVPPLARPPVSCSRGLLAPSPARCAPRAGARSPRLPGLSALPRPEPRSSFSRSLLPRVVAAPAARSRRCAVASIRGPRRSAPSSLPLACPSLRLCRAALALPLIGPVPVVPAPGGVARLVFPALPRRPASAPPRLRVRPRPGRALLCPASSRRVAPAVRRRPAPPLLSVLRLAARPPSPPPGSASRVPLFSSVRLDWLAGVPSPVPPAGPWCGCARLGSRRLLAPSALLAPGRSLRCALPRTPLPWRPARLPRALSPVAGA